MLWLTELMERWLYPLEPLPPRQRVEPMRVLAVGMGRSGTDSLCQALRILGIKNVYHGFTCVESQPSEYGHWALLARKKWGTLRSTGYGERITRQDFDNIIADYTAVTDQPAMSFSMELIEAYPEALVILNTREIDPWHKSIVNTFGVLWSGFEHRVIPWFNTKQYWRKRGTKEAYEAYFYGSLVRNGKMKYREHCTMVRGLVPSGRLLEWQVQDGWEPLCKFLNLPVPDQEFPHGNFPAAMVDRVRGHQVESIRQAWRNFYICLSLCIGIISALVMRFIIA